MAITNQIYPLVRSLKMKVTSNPLLGGLAILIIAYISTPYLSHLSASGILDSLSAAFLVVASCQLVFLLPKWFSAICVSLFICIVIAFNLASGKYYHFQHYYPTIQSAYLLKESPSLIAAYAYWQLLLSLIVASAGFLLLWALAKYSRPMSVQVKIAAHFLLLTASLGFQWSYASTNSGNNFSVIDNSPISHFLRSLGVVPFRADNKENSARHERDIVIRRMSENPDLTLPIRYTAAELSQALGYGAEYESRISSPRHPLFKKPVQKQSGKKQQHNVIILVLESVRASEMGVYGAADSATPFLDSLAANSTIAKKFYATSNYTVKSEHAIHCSALDRFIGSPVAENMDEVKTLCMPNLLKQLGYTTHWFHGNKLSFYNRDEYLPKIGFQQLHDAAVLNVDGTKSMLGWGINDLDFFTEVTTVLSTSKQPFYAEVLTLSNHLPFNYDWGIEFPEHLTSDNTLHQRYRRGIYYTDQAVKVLYEKLQRSGLLDKSILVITGDHGIWSFDDENLPGLYKNEQMNRVPLIIHTPNAQPVVIEGNHSHLDIAPTLVDLLGLEITDDFMGQSIFSNALSKTGRAIYSMAEHAVSYRSANRTCIPSVQCTNSVECTSILEENISNTICYDVAEDEDLLIDDSALLSKNHRFTKDRDLFDYSQIAVEIGSFPNNR